MIVNDILKISDINHIKILNKDREYSKEDFLNLFGLRKINNLGTFRKNNVDVKNFLELYISDDNGENTNKLVTVKEIVEKNLEEEIRIVYASLDETYSNEEAVSSLGDMFIEKIELYTPFDYETERDILKLYL